MAGDLNFPDVITIPDDPLVTAAGGVTPTKFNKSQKLSGGTHGQLMARDTGVTNGFSLTSTPTATMLIFPLNTDPLTLPVGAMTVVDDGTSLTLYIKRLDSSLVSLVVA